jgi:hypothetical protein
MLVSRWVRLIPARGALPLSRPLDAAGGSGERIANRRRGGAAAAGHERRVRRPESRRSDVRAAFIAAIIARRAGGHKDEQFIHEQTWQET